MLYGLFVRLATLETVIFSVSQNILQMSLHTPHTYSSGVL